MSNSRTKARMVAAAALAATVSVISVVFGYFSGKNTDGLAAIVEPETAGVMSVQEQQDAVEVPSTAVATQVRYELLAMSDIELTADPAVRKFLDALRLVETGTRGDSAVGDSGRSIGAYQIRRAYVKDAGMPVAYWRTIASTRELAEATIARYLKRYASAELAAQDWAALAKCHHIGPNFRTRCPQTGQAYADRVLAIMSKQ